MKFTVCEHKVNSRIALLSEDDDPKDWNCNGQVIEAESWQEAREEIDNTYLVELNGEYFYV